nr:phosphoribosyltransferase [Pseudomonas aeruginosa]
MKHVPQTLRGFVSPLALNNDIDVTDAKILLVDDLLSSGTTLRTAHELLMSAGASSVSALCLLSRV